MRRNAYIKRCEYKVLRCKKEYLRCLGSISKCSPWQRRNNTPNDALIMNY